MASGSLLALIDDIASILDDVAVLSKVAAKKTAGVLGDDLALNAQQVTGVAADRELPVVWAVFKGSMLNKLILVPAALAISAFAPWLVTPLLMLGGAFLCYEGFEKLAHRFLHSKAEDDAHRAELAKALTDPAVDLVSLERDRIKGAVRTDFILSAEIIAITLGTVAEADFGTRVVVLSTIALVMTIGVYGLVAGIVKLDDAGLWLSRQKSAAAQALGRGIVGAAPWLMKALSVVGTAAMFLVGGGILVHGVPALHHAIAEFANGLGGVAAAVLPTLIDGLLGVVAGAVVLGAVTLAGRFRGAVTQGLTPVPTLAGVPSCEQALETELAQPRVVVRPAAERPEELALGPGDRQVVDAGMAPEHETLVVEGPVFVAVAAKPLARVVVPFVGEAHRDHVAGEGPEFLDQAVVEFARPLAAQEGLHLVAAGEELGAVAPARVFGVDPCADLRVARVPGVFGTTHLLRRRRVGERGQGRAHLGHRHPFGHQPIAFGSQVAIGGKKNTSTMPSSCRPTKGSTPA